MLHIGTSDVKSIWADKKDRGPEWPQMSRCEYFDPFIVVVGNDSKGSAI